MNFLALGQRTLEKCGIARGTALTSMVGQSGKALEIVHRVNEAYMDIQSQHRDWGFLRASTTWTTIASQATYTPTQCGCTDFGMWERTQFRNYLTATGTDSEIFMTYMDYEAWRDVYQFSAERNSPSQPYRFTITPNKSIGLGPVPLVGYTVGGDYFKAPTELALDADIPVLPTHYHMLIVYRAMMLYAPSDAAVEIYQEGMTEFKKLMSRLENDYLPEVLLAEPLI